jgi:HK97 gp10 family phage protein
MSDIIITGTSDVIRRLNSYSLQLGDLVVKNALNKAAQQLKKQLQQAAPVNQTPSAQFPAGRLKNAMLFKLSKINKRNINGSIGYYVRPRQKSGAGKRYGNQKNAYYAGFVENGYEVKGKGAIGQRRIGTSGLRSGRKTRPSGKHVQGTHFINRTFESNKSQLLHIITQYIDVVGGQLANRLGL